MATAAFIQCECSATTFMAALFSAYDENGIDDIICAIQASFKSSSSRNSACCVVYFRSTALMTSEWMSVWVGADENWVFSLSGILLLPTMTCCELWALSESWGAVGRCWLRFLRGLRCDARLLRLGMEPLNKFHSLNCQQFIIRRATELPSEKLFFTILRAWMNEGVLWSFIDRCRESRVAWEQPTIKTFYSKWLWPNLGISDEMKEFMVKTTMSSLRCSNRAKSAAKFN